jgi:hypothetical protein
MSNLHDHPIMPFIKLHTQAALSLLTKFNPDIIMPDTDMLNGKA